MLLTIFDDSIHKTLFVALAAMFSQCYEKSFVLQCSKLSVNKYPSS